MNAVKSTLTGRIIFYFSTNMECTASSRTVTMTQYQSNKKLCNGYEEMQDEFYQCIEVKKKVSSEEFIVFGIAILVGTLERYETRVKVVEVCIEHF